MSSGHVVWESSHIVVEFDHATAPQLSSDAVDATVRAALDVWTAPNCTGLDLSLSESLGGAVSGDGRNTISIRSDAWSAVGFPIGAAAFADVQYAERSPGDWVIREADIYLNGFDFDWTTSIEASSPGHAFLGSVVAHEIGHLLGVLHPCEVQPTSGVPLCASDPAFESSLMFPEYDGTEIAALSADDTSAICELYPIRDCVPECAGGQSCVAGRCELRCGSTVCDASSVCVADVCRPDCLGFACLSAGDCASDLDCDEQHTCVDAICLPRGGAIGDPCFSEDACISGACSDGFCRSMCDSGACVGDFECELVDEANVCLPLRADFGVSCISGQDCSSRICLLDSSDVNRCTRSCGSAVDLPCPVDFECAVVEGLSVCVSANRPAVGCSASRSIHSPIRLEVVIGFVLMFVTASRSRRRIQA